MPTLTQAPALGDLLKREFDPNYCRETVRLAAGDALPLGTVLGRIAASGQYAPSPASAVAGKEGAEIACAVLLHDVAASAETRQALILARGPAIVAEAQLAFDASVNDPAKKAAKLEQLAAHGLVARTTV